MKEYLLNTIQMTFEVGQDKAERLYEELIECTRHKNMVLIKLLFIQSYETYFGFWKYRSLFSE